MSVRIESLFPAPPKAHNAVSRNFCASRPIPLRIDNDGEFGDLYADVHRPIPTAPDLLVALPDGDHDDDENVVDRILFGPQRDDWLLGRAPPAVETPAYWDDEDNGRPSKSDSAPRVLQKDLEGEARISGIPRGEVERVGDANEGRDSFVGSEARENLRDLDRSPIIPGFSAATGLPGPLFGAGGRVMDWSGSQGRTAIARMVSRSKEYEDDYKDGEDDLVIVTGEGHYHQQDWDEDAMQPSNDGVRKEIRDTDKVTVPACANSSVACAFGSGLDFMPPAHKLKTYNLETEVQTSQSDAAIDIEVKPEGSAQKRSGLEVELIKELYGISHGFDHRLIWHLKKHLSFSDGSFKLS
ncbi:hypothetical protein B296_00012914 [Ensete ventricosum]|uniref:Uncharacterized protein n=1 Tax=Ensete ventricosum TaxID=4639 RepID=A0A427AAE6_ENSVE|nr:hypothetical protein B296_00012914 [Ensete ventricosum]